MLLNRWMEAILHYFGGRDEQNSGISARRDFDAGARAGCYTKISPSRHHGPKNNEKSLPYIDQVAPTVLSLIH